MDQDVFVRVDRAVPGRVTRRNFLGASLAAVSGALALRDSWGAEAPIKMRIALTTAANSLTDKHVHIFVDELEKAAPGMFAVQVFPNSQLGTGTELVQALRFGTIEMSPLGSEGLSIDPKLSFFELPWVMPNFQSFVAAVSGPLFSEIERIYDRGNLVLLAIYGSGFRDVLTRTPMRTLADFKGQRIRIAPSPGRVAFFKRLGAIPVTIEWANTYLALQSGAVDGVEAFPIFLRSGKMYEQAKFLDHIRYVSAPTFMAASKTFWAQLPKTAQEALRTAGRASVSKANAISEAEEQREIGVMKENGVTEVNTDLAGFETIRAELVDDFAKKYGSDWLKMAGIGTTGAR